MTNLNKILILIFILFLSNCTEKYTYTGKVFNNEIDFTQLQNKNDLIKILGKPNFIDPIEKKYLYFSEKKLEKNFFSEEIVDRKLIVFNLNQNDTIKSFSEYNLNNENEINIVKEETSNTLIEQGLLEQIFGGVGTTPQDTQ